MAFENQDISYFHLISGNDYPCKSNEEIDAFFERHSGESFMKFDTDEEVRIWRKKKYPNRYRKYHFNDSNIPVTLRLLKPFIKVWQKMGGYLRGEIDNIYGGWQWFSWHRTVVSYVLDYIEQNPLYLDRMRYTACVDELFFHTMLYPVLDSLNIQKDNALRYIDWHPKRFYKTLPLVLTEQDYSEIVNTDAIFCRKVNVEESVKLIKQLQTNILQK